MWWLTFLNGGVVIIEASSLIHARSLAAARGLGRVVHFAEGHFINPESAALIPDAFFRPDAFRNRGPAVAGPNGKWPAITSQIGSFTRFVHGEQIGTATIAAASPDHHH